ncbi:hypothetical protein LCGC14_1461500 [marine sediment metagenome]|uniref:Uncharacterized protein n=1 Tax=marine sediment metagenome TaxID=412755 RepID=A0A0F9K116_9ZZZZ
MSLTFDREELQRIEVKAREASRAVRNEGWKRALQDLEHAANVLDAFEARSSERRPYVPQTS